MDETLNRPEIVAEVAALFERYEQALIDADVDVLDSFFWNAPQTIRFAVRENCYGFAEIHAARLAMPKGGSKARRTRLEILTLGADLATVNLEYRTNTDQTGRQSQTWVRFAEAGWKIIAAHVSIMTV